MKMKAIKSSVFSLLFSAVASNEFVPESKPDLFTLDEDKFIIVPTKDQT